MNNKQDFLSARPNQSQVSLYSLTHNDLNDLLKEHGHSSKQLPLLKNLIYRSRHKPIQKFSQLSASLRQTIENQFSKDLPKIETIQRALDGTVKLLLKLNDGLKIETVILPFYKKYTLCLSSQVGCAMNCSFCFTAKQGLQRQLKVEEIISQVIVAQDFIKNHLNAHEERPRSVKNLVFMGQGEPLHNFDVLKKSIEILTHPNGFGLSKRNITVSTVGYLDGLKRVHELGGVNIALSLHYPDDQGRLELIPTARKFKLEDIFREIDQIPLKNKQTIEYEYLLIKDFNNSSEHAQKLYELLKDRTHMINLISYNPIPGLSYQRPSDHDVRSFIKLLVDKGLRVMHRKIKGDDILAACGQLNSTYSDQKKEN